jgi:hypothetical protein
MSSPLWCAAALLCDGVSCHLNFASESSAKTQAATDLLALEPRAAAGVWRSRGVWHIVAAWAAGGIAGAESCGGFGHARMHTLSLPPQQRWLS